MSPTLWFAFVEYFINPWLLSGLALLSAPLIIHLLNRRRYEIVEWAAMDFLLQAQAQNRRRLRLEDLFLLLLRLLLVALIVFALSRPLLHGLGPMQEDERYVILDTSFSTDARGGAGSVFDEARSQAVRLIEEGVGRSMTVGVWDGSTGRVLGSVAEIAAPSGEATGDAAAGGGTPAPVSEARAASYRQVSDTLTLLRSLESSDGRLNLPAALANIENRISAGDQAIARSVTILSDFRRADWFEDGASRLHPELRTAFRGLSERAGSASLRVELSNVGRLDAENVAAVAIRADTKHPLVNVPLRVVLTVKNPGSRERTMVRGEIEIGAPLPNTVGADGASSELQDSDTGSGGGLSTTRRSALIAKPGGPFFTARQRIPLPAIETIAPGETATTSVELTFDEPGNYPIVARLGADALPRDDVTFAVIGVRDGISVLVVDGDPGEGRFDGESGFLLTAVSPRGAIRTGISPRRVTGAFSTEDLLSADVALLLNRRSFSAQEREALVGFVGRGAGVGIFLGNQVTGDAYRPLFGDETGSGFPLVLGEATTPRPGANDLARAHLQVENWDHEAFAAFRGIDGSSLEMAGFDRFFQLTPAPRAKVVARFDDSDNTPAIVEFRPVPPGAGSDGAASERGAEDATPAVADDAEAGERLSVTGRVAVFNMTADRDWNDWPTDPSFPVIVQEWVRYLAPAAGDALTSRVGQPLIWQTLPGLRYDVLTPTGERREAGSGDRGLASYLETSVAGLYCVVPTAVDPRARFDPSVLRPRWFAVCRDAAESDLHPADAAALRAGLEDVDVQLAMTGQHAGENVTESGSIEGSAGSETWRLCALGAGLFLLLELFCAWWFGRKA